tara:strand:+ start:845 stop:1105 length:261 start_codon:yes stop_codon:yes gene_type:complete
MKKYTQYLTEQYIPLSRDELDELHSCNQEGWRQKKRLLKEVEYLRSLLDVAYEFIGRKPVKPSPIRYNEVLAEAYRIHREDKEVKQ